MKYDMENFFALRIFITYRFETSGNKINGTEEGLSGPKYL